MKEMKLYADVHRIHAELAAIGIGPHARLTEADLTPFDQYHYFGTAAVDEAMAFLQVGAGDRVLDVGSGLGGPARYLADRSGAEVTALELQPDLNEVARDLTDRCGLSGHVMHRCGNVLNAGLTGYDAVISMLCFLHIPPKDALFAAVRAALKPGGRLYVEDFGLARALTATEAEVLRVKVQCTRLLSAGDYADGLHRAGFDHVQVHDATQSWAAFAIAREADFRAARARNVALHGAQVVDGLQDFYAAVAGLWDSGALSGLKISAR